MISFLTLFLGLMVGRHPVEVTLSGPVARVEFLLDGVKVAEAAAPPWRSTLDFGGGLTPHELVARAFDAAGKPLGSSSQWINLPRPRAEVEITLETRSEGGPQAARLTWQSFDNSAPSSIELKLDEVALSLDGQARALLPPLDLQQTHVLSAELHFGQGSDRVVGRRDVVLGGAYGSELTADLTAIPLRVRGQAAKELLPSALEGHFAIGGQPLAVAAVERGPAKVLFVSATSGLHFHDRYFADLLASRAEMRFAADTQLAIVAPGAQRVGGSVLDAELFDSTQDFRREDGGFPYLLAVTADALGKGAVPPRIHDAVAVAGLLASAENRRRAVVLILGDAASAQRADGSRFTPQQVRRYLADIGVPLYVWNPRGTAKAGADAGWGKVEDVSTLGKLRRAFDKVEADLETQRIALVEGHPLLRQVAFTALGGKGGKGAAGADVQLLVPNGAP